MIIISLLNYKIVLIHCFLIISFPILFNLGKIRGEFLSPPNSAWKQLLPFPPCVDAPASSHNIIIIDVANVQNSLIILKRMHIFMFISILSLENVIFQ